MYSRREMLDLVVIDEEARGIVCRNLVTGEIEFMLVMPFFYVPVDMGMYFTYLLTP